MSLGYGSYCELFKIENNIVFYKYSGYNWNIPDNHDFSVDNLDGILEINISSLEEPEIHIKLKNMPSKKKKLVEKRILHSVGIVEKIVNGDIVIHACKNDFTRYTDKWYLATTLLHKIFESYQKKGVLSDKESLMQ